MYLGIDKLANDQTRRCMERYTHTKGQERYTNTQKNPEKYLHSRVMMNAS